jgi:hypothetical protein
MKNRGDRPDLSLAQQYLFLKSSRVGDGVGSLKAAALTWEYRDRPTPLSREYILRIVYRLGMSPQVFVLNPDIAALAGNRELPHVYRNPLRLCLYLPGSGEWAAHLRIDQTFVSWASVWLFYFEEWLASGEWKGGGVHPQPADREEQPRRARRASRSSR